MFGSMKNLGALAGLLGRKDELEAAAKEIAQRVAAMRVEGSAGGGACRAWVTGNMRLERVEFDPAVLAGAAMSPEGKSQLERLTAEAVNDASEKCQRLVAEMIRDEAERLGVADLLPKNGGGLGGPFGPLLGGGVGGGVGAGGHG
ncbi:MAG: YbaB/EbfC family nucleoid-associated protein [Planctomycetota bacterium]